jgi:histone deacetylase 11
MTLWYLFKLNYSIAVCSIIELPLIFLPGWALRWRVLDPFQRASLGSVEAAVIAHQVGWGINLGGGFHHAHHSDGGGFCVYPDITFVTHYMESWYNYKRFLIIDLDAHQGNGHERDHGDRLKYCIFDVYNHYIYPGDQEAKKAISYDIDASECPDDYSYLLQLERQLPKAFQEFKPDFVIYNAGTDCMDGDPLGRLNLSPEAIIQRDEIVFRIAMLDHKVPIVMLLSGGYQHSNAPCIAMSIRNLVEKFNLSLARGSELLESRKDS